jgi:hypothetical protein
MQAGLLIMLSFAACICSDNFVKVDVYYGELKSEVVTQDLAYDVQSFFGNL